MRSSEFLQKACSHTEDLEGQDRGEGLGLGQCVTPGLPSSGCFSLPQRWEQESDESPRRGLGSGRCSALTANSW